MITPDSISSALAQTNFIKSNGYLSDYRFLYLTTTDATVHSTDDIRNIVIRNDGKRIVRIGDISSVEIKEAIEYTKINANGSEGILIAIIKQPNANLIDLSDQMEKKVTELRKILPEGVGIQPYYVQADFVKTSIKSVSDSLLIGLALAIIVAIIVFEISQIKRYHTYYDPCYHLSHPDCIVCSRLHTQYHDAGRHCSFHRSYYR